MNIYTNPGASRLDTDFNQDQQAQAKRKVFIQAYQTNSLT